MEGSKPVGPEKKVGTYVGPDGVLMIWGADGTLIKRFPKGNSRSYNKDGVLEFEMSEMGKPKDYDVKDPKTPRVDKEGNEIGQNSPAPKSEALEIAPRPVLTPEPKKEASKPAEITLPPIPISPEKIKREEIIDIEATEVPEKKENKVEPAKKVGQHSTPEGEEFYSQDGILEAKLLKDGTTEEYDKEGRLTHRNGQKIDAETEIPSSSEIPTPPEELPAPHVTPSTERPGLFKRHWGKILLSLGIASGAGYFATKPISEKEKAAPIKQATTAQIRIASKDTNQPVAEIYTVAPGTNLTANAEEVKAKLEKALADAKNEVEKTKKDLEEKKAELDKMKTEKSKAPAQPKPINKSGEEVLAEIRAKLARGEKITADEASIHNMALMRTKRTIMPVIEIVKTKKTEHASDINEPGVNPYQSPTSNEGQINTTEGGYVETYRQPSHTPEGTILVPDNPFQLSREDLEQVEEIYENNLDKIFPDPSNALKVWRKVQNKNVYELMNTPEPKVKKEHRLLYSYLKKLSEISKLNPSLNEESVQKYMERALQKGAKEGKLEELKLK